nr:hypothetical protein Iba_chr05cCG3280 [Ipomoea batatas]GMC96918.1 hypothetical protein Iba_chr05dCG2110 [Ipomoea batatas]
MQILATKVIQCPISNDRRPKTINSSLIFSNAARRGFLFVRSSHFPHFFKPP